MNLIRKQLHVVTTGRQELGEVAEIVSRLPVHLIDMLHIREKHRPAQELIRWYETLKPLLPHTALLLNDRVDAALAVRANGVQLGGGSLSALQARALLPAGSLIGCSVHAPDEGAAAAAQGADFAVYGHVYETGSKPGLPARGLSALTQTVQASALPVIAIGGIRPELTADVLAAGAAGIAVLSSILLHQEPGNQVVRFREALDRTNPTSRRELS
ncbi:thiamine phosphate synthase [Paenibacillus filicis]|uniref:Thiamine phosphate synthase n=1 Tax=Paenibacillus filicis TaxID=669464 RepID=A0ABU9DC97_9BACL